MKKYYISDLSNEGICDDFHYLYFKEKKIALKEGRTNCSYTAYTNVLLQPGSLLYPHGIELRLLFSAYMQGYIFESIGVKGSGIQA